MTDEVAFILEQNRQTHTLLSEIRAEQAQVRKDLKGHYEADEKLNRVIERHSIYFSIFGLGIPVGIGYIAKKLGWL